MTIKRLLLSVVFLLAISCSPEQQQAVPPLILTESSEPLVESTPQGSDDSAQNEALVIVPPSILNFGFVETPTKPSQTALLEWEVADADTVKITRTGGQWGEAGEQWEVPATGSMAHTFTDSLGGFELIYTLEAGGGVEAEFAVTLMCEHEWQFDHDKSICPSAVRTSNGLQQNFENGIMLWIEAQDIVLFSSWNGQTHGIYDDLYDAGVDLIRDERIIPPEGYFQPESAFGKIWRDNDDVRAALGWAIDPAIGYNLVRQGETASRSGVIQEYIGLHDGSWIFIDQSVLVWDVTYPTPTITWAGERPPAMMSDLAANSSENDPATLSPEPETTAEPVVTGVPTVEEPTRPPATAAAPATAVPTPPTIAPTEAAIDGDIRVLQFGFNRDPEKPSDTVELQWNISGVSSIHIDRLGGEFGEANASYDLPAQGTLEQTFSPEAGGWPIVYIITSQDAPDFEHAVTTALPCEWEWLFDFPYDGGGCPERGVASKGSMQTFQNGFMIWIESLDVIVYSTWNGLDHARLTDNYVNDVDPIQDDSINVPEGLFQPQYGFGKVWREQPSVRDLLGWGTDWSRDYTVITQSEAFSRYGFTEYILMNGGLITIENPDPVWRIDY